MISVLLSMLLVPAAAVAAAPWNASKWEMVLLHEAVGSGAVCLDGTPGGYQIRRGAPGDTRWVVFHQGGGWCNDDESCAARANTGLGGSDHPNAYSWGPTYTDTYEGGKLFETPPFTTATLVYALYCDGGSWAGNADKPVIAKPNTTAPPQTIYYRGRRLLDALYDNLLNAGLKDAKELLFAGCSAGGLTVYMHADYIAGRMPATVKTVALADAMFSRLTPDAEGQPLYGLRMQWIFDSTGMNASSSVNQACLAAHPDGTECMMGQNTAPYIKTPLFVINSKYDTWQAGAIIGAGKCSTNISNCSSTIKDFWVEYGTKMVETLVELPPQHGGFLSNCQAHCQTGGNWVTATIDGMLMGTAFTTWYNHTMAVLDRDTNATDHRYYETCELGKCGADTC